MRFFLADPALGVQLALSAAAGLRMPAKVNIHNIWMPSTSLRDITRTMCKSGHVDRWKDALSYLLETNRVGATVAVDDVTAAVAKKIDLLQGPNFDPNRSVGSGGSKLEELHALGAKLKDTDATRISTCCGHLLSDADAAAAECVVCSQQLGCPSKLVEPVQEAARVSLRSAVGHVVRHFVHEGHTRIMALWSSDSVNFLRHTFFSDGVKEATRFMQEIAPSCTAVDGSECNALDLFEGGTGVFIMVMTDDLFSSASATMTGVDLPQCDAVVAVGRIANEAQAFSRALRVSAQPRQELPVARIFWPGCYTGTLAKSVSPSPGPPPAPLPGTATFVRDVLELALDVSGDGGCYDHTVVRSVRFTFRGAGFEKLVVATPPLANVDGGMPELGPMTFTFCRPVISECVPSRTRGITFFPSDGELRFEWVSGAKPGEGVVRLLPVANCSSLDVEVVTREGGMLCATATAA